MIYASQLFKHVPCPGIFGDVFQLSQPVYAWIEKIHCALELFFKQYSSSERIHSFIPPQLFLKGDIFIGKNVKLPPFGTIEGPAYIGDFCELRPGVYIRGNVITGEHCVLGNSCEFKNTILLDYVQVPHFNYVGDSLLGDHAHLGAGCILSNLRFDRQPVQMRDINNEKFLTHLKKLGGVLGDYAEAGCNAVLQPGACLFPHAKVFPCESFNGTKTA